MVTGMQGSRARSALEGTRFADLRWVAETASTNDDLLASARDGAPDGIVLVADHQSAGRGRLDRAWQAPPGSSLLVSMLTRPALAPADAHLVATAVGCAAVDACAETAGVTVALKWPNDVVVVDEARVVQGKVAGILAESIVDDDQLRAVVVGIGLNVNWPVELPPELRGVAIALNHLVGHDVDREDVLIALVVGASAWIDEIGHASGRARLIERYRAVCSTIGTTVRVELHGESFTGRATAISDEGHLVVETAGGAREVIAGDVVHVRAQ
jgi:BirA family biotin operon repressor/biotin-[acetyl-CoA-carboxylase] ligase